MMTPRHAHVVGGERWQGLTPLCRRVFVLSAAILALGIVIGVAGLFSAPIPDAARPGSRGHDPVETMQTASRPPINPAQRPVDIAPAAQESARLVTIGLAEPAPIPDGSLDVNWDAKESIRTIDPDPGGKFQFDPVTGQVRVSDTEEDGDLVRGGVFKGDLLVVRLRAGGNPSDDVKAIPHYDENVTYIFRVCLAEDDDAPDIYCNSSDSANWAEPDMEPDSCSKIEGPAEDYCRTPETVDDIRGSSLHGSDSNGGDIIAPPRGRAPSTKDNPDAHLTKGHAKGAPRVVAPVKRILAWVIWGTYGAGVLGFIIIGANMAIKHRRGEIGEHAAGLGWVAVACIIPTSAAVAVHLLIKPI